MSPLTIPLEHDCFKNLPRPSIARIKRKGDSGFPCLKPLVGLNVEDGESLIIMEKKGEDMREKIQEIHCQEKPKASKTLSK